MVNRKKFYTREEVAEFLKGYDFKYFIPYINEKDGDMWYVVELTKNNKIGYCYEECLRGGFSFSKPFYDCTRAYDFDLEEIGERKRKEYIEMQEYLLSLEDEQ